MLGQAVAWVPWTPGEESRTFSGRQEGPQKVSANRVSAQCCPVPRARHTGNRGPDHMIF